MIQNLQSLRGIAALMVVVFHVTDGAGRLGEGVRLPRFDMGFAGVDLFFVISGFIIFVTTRRPASARPGLFLLRRLLRVAPLYWFLTALLANVAVFAPQLLGATVFELPHFLASLLFWPAPHPTLPHYNPLLVVGWTLNYEMAFYALFALVLTLPARRQAPAAILALLALAGFGRVAEPSGVLGFYADPVILEFAMGLAIGWAWTAGARPPLAACAALALAGAALLVFAEDGTRLWSAGVPAAMLVAGAVFAERARGPLRLPGLRLLGDSSYSLYLVHLLALPVVQIAWRRAGLGAEGWSAYAYVGAATLACVLAGLLCYRLLERPLGQLLRFGEDGRGRAAPPVPAL